VYAVRPSRYGKSALSLNRCPFPPSLRAYPRSRYRHGLFQAVALPSPAPVLYYLVCYSFTTPNDSASQSLDLAHVSDSDLLTLISQPIYTQSCREMRPALPPRLPRRVPHSFSTALWYFKRMTLAGSYPVFSLLWLSLPPSGSSTSIFSGTLIKPSSATSSACSSWSPYTPRSASHHTSSGITPRLYFSSATHTRPFSSLLFSISCSRICPRTLKSRSPFFENAACRGKPTRSSDGVGYPDESGSSLLDLSGGNRRMDCSFCSL